MHAMHHIAPKRPRQGTHAQSEQLVLLYLFIIAIMIGLLFFLQIVFVPSSFISSYVSIVEEMKRFKKSMNDRVH